MYYPPKEIVKHAHIKNYEAVYQKSIEDREGFWADEAKKLEWYKKWDKVLDDSKKPFYKWFTGGKFNIIHNAIDRHLKSATRNKLAIIWEGEPGDLRTFSYHALNREVAKFANILMAMGGKKGDVITIYMPQIPELVIAMLACAKIGAVHSVVYGGFSVESLAERIHDSHSRILITADGGYRRGKATNLKAIANDAMKRSATIEVCITVKRSGQECYMENDRDFWYHDLMSMPLDAKDCKTEVMDAEDPLFILYTSGTTGKAKGLVHTHGGYAVYTATAHKYVFDIKPEDRWWQMIEKYGINILYTSPTAIRGLMRYGSSWANRHDLSSLRLLGSVGEPINPEAWKWYHEVIGHCKCPIMDTWWQTETGGFMITPIPVMPLKPGSCAKPFFGNEIGIVDDHGAEVKQGEEGNLVIKNPWPGMARTILHDPERFVEKYREKYQAQGWYLAGDSAKIDEDGYFWVIGRIDDVIKVSGYRLGSAEIESALVSHAAVTEAAAVGLPDELRGNIIHATVVLRDGFTASEKLGEELKTHVENEIGPIARPTHIVFTDGLPKTRSGKIMRRVVRARVLGQDTGDLTSLEE